MQNASVYYMYLVGLYGRWRCDFAAIAEAVESCALAF